MKDCKIRVENAEESKRVQEKLFKMGVEWENEENETGIYNVSEPYLFVDDDILTCDDKKVVFTDDSNPEITVAQLLKGESMKPTHIVVWEKGNSDPFCLCYSDKEVKDRVKALLRNDTVIEDSILVYEIKKITKPSWNVSFKAVKK